MFILACTSLAILLWLLIKKENRKTKKRIRKRLDGKTAIVTGADSGIGKQTAFELYKMGARVILVCISKELALKAAEEMKGRVEILEKVGTLVPKEMNLASFQSIHTFVREILNEEDAVHVLVNNAGLFFNPNPTTEPSSEQGYEMVFAVNYLGPFLTTLLLLPRMLKSGRDVRIVNVSSDAHSRNHSHYYFILFMPRLVPQILSFYRHLPKRADFTEETVVVVPPQKAGCNPEKIKFEDNFFVTYAKTKIAVVLLTKELAQRLKGTNVKTYSLNPGPIYGTGMFQQSCQRIKTLGIPDGVVEFLKPYGKYFMKSVEQGAEVVIHCATDENCAEESGLYYEECQVAEPDPIVFETERRRKLWDLSWKLTNLKDFNPFEPA